MINSTSKFNLILVIFLYYSATVLTLRMKSNLQLQSQVGSRARIKMKSFDDIKESDRVNRLDQTGDSNAGCVSFYQNVNYGGTEWVKCGTLNTVGDTINDKISSIKLNFGTNVIVYQHQDFGGVSLEVSTRH